MAVVLVTDMLFIMIVMSGCGIARATLPNVTSTTRSCATIAQDLQEQFDIPTKCLRGVILRDCCDSLLVGGKTGIYRILDGNTRGACENDFEGGGWLRILRNNNNNNEKFRTRRWKKYEIGFGSFNQNFFLGLKTLHRLTENSTMQLRVDLTNSSGSYWALYEDFAVGDAQSLYRLRIGNFSGGTLRDLFSPHNNGEFSSIDYNFNSKLKNLVGGWWWMPDGRINFAPYSIRGITWHESEKELDVYHLYKLVVLRIRSRRFPCYT